MDLEGRWRDVFGKEEKRGGKGGQEEGRFSPGPGSGAGLGHAPPAWANQVFDPNVAASLPAVQADIYRQYGSGVVRHARILRRELGRRVAGIREGELMVFSPGGGEVKTLTMYRMGKEPGNADWRAPFEGMKNIARRLALKLRRAQQEVERDKYVEPRGRLDRSRLSQAVKGEKSVFMRHGPGRGQSMAFSFCTDISGSMSSHIGQLQLSLAMMATALDELKIPYEVTAFESGPIQVLKTWDEARLLPEQIDTLGARGGTEYSHPLARAALSAGSREEKKRLVLFLTDGCPFEDWDLLRQEYVEAIRRQGIILVPMLYKECGQSEEHEDEGMDAIFGPHQWIHVSDLRQLPEILMGFLWKTLVAR